MSHKVDSRQMTMKTFIAVMPDVLGLKGSDQTSAQENLKLLTQQLEDKGYNHALMDCDPPEDDQSESSTNSLSLGADGTLCGESVT